MPPDPSPAFGLLGPLKNPAPARPSPKQGLLLAGLLLGGGEPVAANVLAEWIWGPDRPASAPARLRALVTELRRALPDARIATRPPGYAADTTDLDVTVFTALLDRAAKTADPENALGLLDQALALWRGPALTGLDTPPARIEAARLDELRLSTMERRAELLLDLGRHADAVGDLTALTTAHPERERPHTHLMLALFGTGRTAEALAAYRAHETHVREHLGLDPSPELRALHRRILDAAPSLTAARVPHQLPADTPHFTGRTAELDAITTAGNPLVLITGAAGTGKTALAVHWAHRAAHHYPDGQIHLDMRGFDPGPARTADDHVPGILRDLGIPTARIPAATTERRELLHTTLTGRRVLIICDNAAHPDQVRPLVPTTPGSLLIATSRDRLTALDHAHRVPLHPLDTPTALDLLTALIGTTDHHAATALTELCGGLPLALRIAAARLGDNPQRTLAHYTRAIVDNPLAALRVPGDPRADVRHTLTLSYRTLTPPAQRLFRLAATIPAPAGLTTDAARTITGDDPRPLLDELTARHLLTPAGDRHTYHDLLRELGAELAADDPEHTTVTTRLLDHHLATTPTPRDLPNLTAAVHHAAAHGPHDRAWKLTEHLQPLLADQPPTPAAETLIRTALNAADPQGRAAMHYALAVHHRRNGDTRKALDALTQALHGHRATGDHTRQTRTLQAIGTTHFHAGRFTEAITHWTRALHHARTHDDLTTQTTTLNNIAAANGRLGNHPQALADLTAVAALAHDNGDTATRAIALTNIAYFQRDQGDHTAAAANLTEAARLHHDNGSTLGQANAHCGLGLTHLDTGAHDTAAHHLRTALDHATRNGDPKITVYILCGLARHALDTGDPTRATALLGRAEPHLAHTPGDHCAYAIALHRAHTALHTGDHHTARHHATTAMNLARQQPADHATAQALRARAHLALGDHTAAHHDATTALATQTRLGHHPAAEETRRTLDHARTMRETGAPTANINTATPPPQRSAPR